MSDMAYPPSRSALALHNFGRGMTQSMLIPMFTPMLCDYDQGSPAIKADMAHQSGAGEANFLPW
jgi:hypothetical protein